MAFGASSGPCVQGLTDTRLRLMDQTAQLVTMLPSRTPASYPASHVALLLLTFCVAPKADHLLRHLPPAISATFAPRVDRLLLETFQSILGARLSPSQAEQARFPLSAGGVGLLARSGALAAGAYVGSWALVYHRVAAATGWSLPGDSSSILPGTAADHLLKAIQATRAAGAAHAQHFMEPAWWAAA